MASIIRCDRCGEEMPQKEWIELPLYRIDVLRDSMQKIEHIDLCDKCKEDFEKWLKGGTE